MQNRKNTILQRFGKNNSFSIKKRDFILRDLKDLRRFKIKLKSIKKIILKR